MDPEVKSEDVVAEKVAEVPKRVVLDTINCSPALWRELKLLSKRMDIAREAITLEGKDSNFYKGAMDSLAECDIEKAEWEEKLGQANPQGIPPGTRIDPERKEFFTEE